jgi:drug/metabolite transporter (DMT)-like permease
MKAKNLKKGLIFGVIGVFLIGLQPIIANSRPKIIDPYIFAAITAIIEAIIFLPLYFFERKGIILSLKKNKTIDVLSISSLLNGWKKRNNIKLLILIGLIFSIVPILLYIGFATAGAILSSLALKSEVIFALLFGSLILKEEKISKIQALFCILLFLGLIIAITQGSFNLLEFNVGVLILIISVALFTFVHALTKSAFDRNELFPTQVVFIRNLLSGVILLCSYILIFRVDHIVIFFKLENFVFFLLMGIDYGFSLFLWYKTLTYIEIGKAGIINSLTPIVSSFFAFLILGEKFTTFHLIGTVIVIFSIYMIMTKKKENF